MAMKTSLLIASASGYLVALKWKALVGGQVLRKAQLSWKTAASNPAAGEETSAAQKEIVVALHCNEVSKRTAIATEAGRVAVLNFESALEKGSTATPNATQENEGS